MSSHPILLHHPAGDRAGVLATDHSASSYGQPVLVVGGVPFGPGDTFAGERIASLVVELPAGAEPDAHRAFAAWCRACEAADRGQGAA